MILADVNVLIYAGRDGEEAASAATVAAVAARAEAFRQQGCPLVASIHWGRNWGYAVPPDHRVFAHDLIDAAGFAVVHGHPSHHALAIEVYEGRLVLYGCGDFITDYEGIAGYEAFRGDPSLPGRARRAGRNAGRAHDAALSGAEFPAPSRRA